MQKSAAELPVPDDTGAQTFSRFVYQALVTAPFCCECANGGDIINVYTEHVEDVALETSSGWRFIQIKTRDASRGAWRLTDITSGAFKSLIRTMKAVGFDSRYTLEAHIEGAVANGDGLNQLVNDPLKIDDDCRQKLRTGLEISEKELDEFLVRLRVRADLPSRDTIEAVNIQYMAVGSGKSYEEVRAVHTDLVALIQML